MMRLTISIFALAMLSAAPAFAQTPKCDALTGDHALLAKKVISSAYLYDCCDETIAKCLQKENRCKLAVRLADEVCRLASAGKSESEIKHLLDQRSMVMTDITKASKIEMSPGHVWGNKDSKVVLSVYLCGRCPYCSKFTPALIRAIDEANLKDKIALNLRLFPIKSHENSTPSALAVEAAAKRGLGWEMLLKIYEDFDSYTPEFAVQKAAELGISANEFNQQMNDPGVRSQLAASKKEGLTNGVESTPTFFLNGRKIQSAFDAESLVSMLNEALEK